MSKPPEKMSSAEMMESLAKAREHLAKFKEEEKVYFFPGDMAQFKAALESQDIHFATLSRDPAVIAGTGFDPRLLGSVQVIEFCGCCLIGSQSAIEAFQEALRPRPEIVISKPILPDWYDRRKFGTYVPDWEK